MREKEKEQRSKREDWEKILTNWEETGTKFNEYTFNWIYWPHELSHEKKNSSNQDYNLMALDPGIDLMEIETQYLTK